MSACCQDRNMAKKPTWAGRFREVGAWMAPSVALALLPKCPACVAAYIALGTGIGISMPAARYVRVSLIIACVAALAFLAARRTRRLIHRLRAGY